LSYNLTLKKTKNKKQKKDDAYFSSYSNFSFINGNIISANNDETGGGSHFSKTLPTVPVKQKCV